MYIAYNYIKMCPEGGFSFMPFLLLPLIPIVESYSSIIQKKYTKNTMHITSAVEIYMIVTTLTGILFFAVMARGDLIPNKITLFYSALFSITVICANLFKILAIYKSDLVTITVFAGAGEIIIPVLFDMIFLAESVHPAKIASVVILLVTTILPLLKHRANKKTNLQGYILCVLLLISIGFTVIVCKLYALNQKVLDDNIFCFWTNIIMIPFIAIIILKSGNAGFISSDFRSINRKDYIYAIFSILLGNVTTLLQIFVLGFVSVTVFTITKTSLLLIFTAFMSRLFFKEKISLLSLVSIVLSIIAIVLNAI